ncbi:uncharacterized protein [Centroberyx affinis]|uniref:uncharacterized protein n=1 Tax=Centroberyx affinis TaxID=166261 RepID=UPI003A5BC006
MRGHWWSCLLALLCMPAGALLDPWTVSQNPPAISLMRVNSSAEILCSTSLSDPMGLYLLGYFHGDRSVVYVSLVEGRVTKKTVHLGFADRVDVVPDPGTGPGCGFTLRLSPLGPEDTDVYYCRWSYFNTHTSTEESLESNGTVVIVRERDPQEQCNGHVMDLIVIVLSMTTFIIVLFVFTGAMILKCTRFKKHYRPARAVARSRHQHVFPQHRGQQLPNFSRSANSLDFRGIL